MRKPTTPPMPFPPGRSILHTVSSTISLERRKAARFSVRVPIRVSEVGAGVTIDISAAGVSFIIDQPMQAGRIIRFQLKMDEPGGPLEVHCDGRVVRVDQRGDLTVAAATIDELTVRNLTDH